MERKKLPKSIRKFIRREKARIRAQVLDLKKQKELIDELYAKFLGSGFSKNNKPFQEKSKEDKNSSLKK